MEARTDPTSNKSTVRKQTTRARKITIMPSAGDEFAEPAAWDFSTDGGVYTQGVDWSQLMHVLARQLHKTAIGLNRPVIKITIEEARH